MSAAESAACSAAPAALLIGAGAAPAGRGGGLLSLAAGLFAADLAGTWVTSHASLSGDRMARLIGVFRTA